MSFPSTVYASYGDEKTVSPTKIGGLPLGQRMELPDGRVFRHSQASATALVAGKLYQGVAQNADTIYVDSTVPAATAAIGATLVQVVTGGTTAIGDNEFEDGYLLTASSAGGGVGEVYKIRTNPAAASASTTCNITLYQQDTLKTAIRAGTTTLGLVKNEYKQVTVATADTVRVAAPVGIPTTAVAASNYCWIQRRGPAPMFTAATIGLVGVPVTSGTAVTGAMGSWKAAASAAAASWPEEDKIGYCMVPAGTAANFGMVYLTLE